MVLAALLAGILINVHPGQRVASEPAPGPEPESEPVAAVEKAGLSPEY
jgi:hypothetical protein